MQIHREDSDAKFLIKRYEPGSITINQDTYTNSLIVTPSELHTDWRPQSFDDILGEDFALLAKLKPEVVIIGSGEQHQFCNPSLLTALYNANIGVESMSTAAACRTFNVLLSEGRVVAAALILK